MKKRFHLFSGYSLGYLMRLTALIIHQVSVPIVDARHFRGGDLVDGLRDLKQNRNAVIEGGTR